ncbi:hypothetical protein V0M98_24425 [Pseudomonas silesiensis]|uniref:hypothetical protein n=1 Tax=Pseudomonas silesiensis TaxID=1853130 RepID=UPI0030D10691
MQKDDANLGSKFKLVKKIGAWALVPGLGVPVTKFVERYYDVSLFSPALSGLWNWILSIGTWLNQSFPLQLWMLLAITVCVAVMAVAGLWAFSDKSRELKAARAGLEAVDRELKAAYSRIKDLENPCQPEIQALSSSQQLVLDFIAACEHEGSCPFVRDYVRAIDLSHLQVKGALDVLTSRGLVKTIYAGTTLKALLTPAGREFVLSAEGV